MIEMQNAVYLYSKQSDDKLENIVIRKVKRLHSVSNVNLEQILVSPFKRKDGRTSDISVCFKINKRTAKIEDLAGGHLIIIGAKF